MEKKFSRFSVPLGLLVDVNPILYSVTMVTIIRNLYSLMERPYNTVFLTGAVGYLLLYTSLITLSVRGSAALPVVLYACAILLFIMLCGIGIRTNLKNPKVHWVIEVSNVLCQLLVAVSTIILFS